MRSASRRLNQVGISNHAGIVNPTMPARTFANITRRSTAFASGCVLSQPAQGVSLASSESSAMNETVHNVHFAGCGGCFILTPRVLIHFNKRPQFNYALKIGLSLTLTEINVRLGAR